MTDSTARLALPLLDAGQAQKEVTHNEALTLIDLAVQASVVSVGLNVPPAAPLDGQAWIVGDAPGGDWTGHARAITGWAAGGWRFVSAREGMAVWSAADGVGARFVDGAWLIGSVAARAVVIDGVPVVGPRRAPIAAVTGGSVVDSEARAAIAAIVDALKGHGLIGV